MLGNRQSIRCRLRTVSEIISRFGLNTVDFLKVDVERGELDVLSGIALADWPKIKSLAVEVHDIEGRLGHVVTLLKTLGFTSVVSDQSLLLRGTVLTNVYARRS